MKNLNASRIVITFLFVAIVGLVSLLFFVLLNSGASLDNARQAQSSYKEESDALRSLLVNMSAMNQEKTLQLVQKNYSTTHVVKSDSDSISIDSVSLRYKNGALIQVCSIQDGGLNSCASRPE